MFKGFSFLPTTLGYWCATSFLVKIIDKFKSVVSTSSAGIVSMFFGLMLYTANGEVKLFFLIYAQITNLVLLESHTQRASVISVANWFIGFGVGLVDTAQFTLLGLFFKYGDYGNNYGSIYAIGDLAFCIAFSFGPIMTSTLSNVIGFMHTLQLLGLLIILSLPLLYMLRGHFDGGNMDTYEQMANMTATSTRRTTLAPQVGE